MLKFLKYFSSKIFNEKTFFELRLGELPIVGLLL